MKPPHILIVDDEVDFRETLNLLLSMQGFQVSEASSGDHAIMLTDAGLRPDVILLDYRMPGRTGGATLEYMRPQALE